MKTKFPFTLEIDERKFELTYKELNKKQSKEVLEAFNATKTALNAYTNIKDEIAVLEEKKAAKKEIAGCLKGEAKASAMQEVLELIDEISAKQKELKTAEATEVDIENIAKKRFELSIDGKDAQALKATVEELGIGYNVLMDAVDEQIQKERVKK
nr:hypothetical protein [uncultured Campylobacter sp.]DAK27409.1 MAG TPA: hypothetical protein [Caudoviricetes sp.]